MKIGLIDAEMYWSDRAVGRRYGKTKADVFPNIVLMKISAYYKQHGHEVEWYNGLFHYDVVFISKVFSDTIESREIINADDVIYGGTGYNIKLIDGTERFIHPEETRNNYIYWPMLPDEIERIFPDYSLYPMVKDTAFGFLSRGCPRGCSFCHVAAKEGRNSCKVSDLREWWNGQKNIVLCDPNILACKDWKNLLQQLADSGAYVDINQGLDARLITPEKMELINKIRLKSIHFAWDDYKQKDKVLKGLRCFVELFKRKLDRNHFAQVYVLVNFDTTLEQDLERIYTLRDMNLEPYVMIYDKAHAAPVYKSLQRWVNMRAIFHKVKTFEEYDRLKAKE